ncbi:MAG: glycosyltransferase family 4 protein [Candidatus Goldbacteria bacterium]|nr:glycosyltransferase family 4 protein [Candidatus Goldiibacteriota bacterium]
MKSIIRKIALVTPYYYPLPGGVQEYVYHLKKEYKKMGFFTKVITGASNGISPKDEDDVIRIGKNLPFIINGSTGQIVLVAKKNKIKEILDKYNFDIIHFQEPFVPFLSHSIIKNSKAINIGTFHANFDSNFFYRISTNFLSPLWDKLHGKIAVSPSARSSITKYFRGEVEIIPNGVDTTRFNPKNPKIKKFDDDKINILFTGRIEKRKGLIYLLKAYANLKEKFPNIRLIIVGKGPLLNEHQNFVKKNKLKDVFFEGYVSIKELPYYYSTADIYCSPALFGESFGIVLLEAMASGIPVVAFNISGYNDVVANLENGLLAIPRDVHDLTEKLELLIKDKNLRKELGNKGLIKARNHTWEKIAKKNISYYYKIYESVMSGRKNTGAL